MAPRILVTNTGSCSVTIGVQLLSTVSAFLGLKYSQLIYMIFVPLSSVMACKVFRMVLLCDTTVDPLNTAEVHEMLQQGQEDVDLGDIDSSATLTPVSATCLSFVKSNLYLRFITAVIMRSYPYTLCYIIRTIRSLTPVLLSLLLSLYPTYVLYIQVIPLLSQCRLLSCCASLWMALEAKYFECDNSITRTCDQCLCLQALLSSCDMS